MYAQTLSYNHAPLEAFKQIDHVYRMAYLRSFTLKVIMSLWESRLNGSV